MWQYKIYNPKLNKYSSGGTIIRWSKVGKVWASKKNLDLHLKLLKSDLPKEMEKYIEDDCRIVVYSFLQEESIKSYLQSL